VFVKRGGGGERVDVGFRKASHCATHEDVLVEPFIIPATGNPSLLEQKEKRADVGWFQKIFPLCT